MSARTHHRNRGSAVPILARGPWPLWAHDGPRCVAAPVPGPCPKEGVKDFPVLLTSCPNPKNGLLLLRAQPLGPVSYHVSFGQVLAPSLGISGGTELGSLPEGVYRRASGLGVKRWMCPLPPCALTSLMSSETSALLAPESSMGVVPPQRPLSGPESVFFYRSFPFPLLPRLVTVPRQCCHNSKWSASPSGSRHLAPILSWESGAMWTAYPPVRWQTGSLGVTPPSVVGFSFLACLASGQTSSSVTCLSHSSYTGQGFPECPAHSCSLLNHSPGLFVYDPVDGRSHCSQSLTVTDTAATSTPRMPVLAAVGPTGSGTYTKKWFFWDLGCAHQSHGQVLLICYLP